MSAPHPHAPRNGLSLNLGHPQPLLSRAGSTGQAPKAARNGTEDWVWLCGPRRGGSDRDVAAERAGGEGRGG
jgi:hypothetical protein